MLCRWGSSGRYLVAARARGGAQWPCRRLRRMPARIRIFSFYCSSRAPRRPQFRQLTRSPEMAIAELPPQSVRHDHEPQSHGLRFERSFTRDGVHPYDAIQWERRDALIPGEGGNVFEQKGVEVPAFWSMTATNVVASKYFRGKLGTPARESSVKQMVDRVVDTIARAGFEAGYFASEADRDAFSDELKYLMVRQYASFNSPVWFNIGVPGVPQQPSACFILSVEDEMRSILDWFSNEGVIFKGGSGSGVNVSKIRSKRSSCPAAATPPARCHSCAGPT